MPLKKRWSKRGAAWLGALLFAVVGQGCGDTDEQNASSAATPTATTTGTDQASVTYETGVAPGAPSLRRLTKVQFENAVIDLLGDDLVVPELAEVDLSRGGLLSVGASEVTFSPRGVESLETTIYAVAEQALETEERRARLVPCAPTATVDSTCAKAFVAGMGLRAWRRALEDEETDRLVAIADRVAGEADDFYVGLEYALAALLQSPNFLFRAELGGEALGTFSDLELASRLSFFLWNTTPDAELLEAAKAGELGTDAGLRRQAERLLASEKVRHAVRNFFEEYLELYELEHLSKDPNLFEHYSSLLGPDAREETLSLLEHLIFDLEADYRDLMTTRETFLSPRLAALYGVPAPVNGGFGLATLPHDAQRAGLLGHASFLAHHAHPVSSSATLRGVAVRTLLLCQEVPPPPVDVDTSIPEPSGNTLTLRDRVSEHLENPSCSGCHLLFDPLGLGLENFDGIGRWRERDNGAMIDATGELSQRAFDGPRELGEAIREHPDFAPCLVKMLTRYATGREETEEENAHLKVLSARFEQTHTFRVKPLLLEIVMSPMFREAGEVE